GLGVVLRGVGLLGCLVVLQRRILLRTSGRLVPCGLHGGHLLGGLGLFGSHWTCPFWTLREYEACRHAVLGRSARPHASRVLGRMHHRMFGGTSHLNGVGAPPH